LLIAEALWLRACEKDPNLNALDGSLRTKTVERFRELDRKRIQLTRGEVLARYLESRPNGQTGEMGVIRAEIGKKRRHLPIRKLMEQAGSAVQRLKPVFLTSPLSVAARDRDRLRQEILEGLGWNLIFEPDPLSRTPARVRCV
jgi:hypothetical protein